MKLDKQLAELGLELLPAGRIYLTRAPITRRQFRAIVGFDPAYSLAHVDAPVERVSWQMADEAARRLNLGGFCRRGEAWRLPSRLERYAIAAHLEPQPTAPAAVFALARTAGWIGLRGLVWEWTADLEGKRHAWAAGSCWLDAQIHADSPQPEISIPSDSRWHCLGFRLAYGPSL